MTKLIVSDYDGTLITAEKKELSLEFITKIKNSTNKGMLFSVNSGRNYDDLKKLMKPLFDRTIFICNDGCQIMYKNCLLYKNVMDFSSVKAIFTEAYNKNVKAYAALRESIKKMDKDVYDCKGLFSEDVYKAIIIKKTADIGTLNALKEIANSNNLRVCYEDDDYLEFCTKNSNKGMATEFIKNKFGIQNGVVAFGDAKTDFKIFEVADEFYLVKSKNNIFYPDAKIISNAQDYILENF